MPEEMDAKVETVSAEGFNAKADAILDAAEASSASKEAPVQDAKPVQEAGADQPKNANLDQKVADENSVEAKLAKIAEILGDDQKAVDAYVKSKGYHKDSAWQKLLHKAPALDEATQKELEKFKQVTSSPE